MVRAELRYQAIDRRFMKQHLTDFLQTRFEIPMPQVFLGHIGEEKPFDDQARRFIAAVLVNAAEHGFERARKN